MIDFLLASTLTCADARWIIAGIRQVEDLDTVTQTELIIQVMGSTDKDCDFSVPTHRE